MVEEQKSIIESEILRYSKLYEDGKTGWHHSSVNQSLVSNIHLFPKNPSEDELVSGAGSPIKIFIPLCGKTVDIPYLLTLGYHVFGIESSKEAILQLSKENLIELTFDVENSTFKTKNEELMIFNGNYFDCPIEKFGPFHVIWDKASWNIFMPSLRTAYASIIRRAVHGISDWKYFLNVYEYDKDLGKKPPFPTSIEDLKEYFPDWKISLLHSQPPSRKFLEHETHAHIRNTSIDNKTYLITKK